MSPWLWTESRANVRLITLDSLLPTLTPGINGRQFGVHGLDHHCPRLTRSRIQPEFPRWTLSLLDLNAFRSVQLQLALIELQILLRLTPEYKATRVQGTAASDFTKY
jgi:hypothetical protein